ncbi:amidohydrolase 3 protein [Colletotrichum asianum]
MDSSAMDLDHHPPDLRQLRDSYKAATNCFLRWLWCQYHIIAPDEASNASTFKHTAEMVWVAKKVEEARTDVPKSIISFLDDAIRDRTIVFQMYDDAEAGHKHIIRTLQDIHRILKPLESQSEDVVFVDYAADAQQTLWNNAFQALHVDDSAESSHGSPRSGSENSGSGDASSPASAPTQPAQPQAQPMGPIEFDLEDDEITQMIDSAWFLIEMNKMRAQLQQIWAEAARGDVPIVSAAWLTSLAVYDMSDRDHIPRDYLNKFCLMQAYNCRCNSCQMVRSSVRKLDDEQDPDECLQSAVRLFKTAKAIGEYGQRIGDFRAPQIDGRPWGSGERFTYNITNTNIVSEPPSFPDSYRNRIHEALESVRVSLPLRGHSARAVARAERLRPYYYRGIKICEAFFDVAQRFFLQEENPRKPSIFLVTTMDLFMLTADAASTHGGRLGGPQCRVATLELSLQVRDCLAQFKPDTDLLEHYPDVADQVRDLSTAIHYYIMENKSGLYYESPWTMGCHMLEFLTAANSIGLKLCKRYAVFHSILHIYNAMRRLNIKELSIPKNYELDKLCQMFVWPVFKGNMSMSGFLSVFLLAVYQSGPTDNVKYGAATRLERGVTFSEAEPYTCWISLTEHHDYLHSQDPIFFTKIYNRPVPLVCPCLECTEGTSSAYRHKIEQALREHASTKLSGYTAKARALLTAELSAETPLSRLNMLKLFQAYAEMLSGFGRLARPELEPAYRKQWVWRNEMKHGLVLGRFAVEDTLELIDLNFGGTTKEKRRLARHPLLLGAAKMFNDMQEGRQPEDAKLERFLWDLA